MDIKPYISPVEDPIDPFVFSGGPPCPNRIFDDLACGHPGHEDHEYELYHLGSVESITGAVLEYLGLRVAKGAGFAGGHTVIN